MDEMHSGMKEKLLQALLELFTKMPDEAQGEHMPAAEKPEVLEVDEEKC